MHELTSEPSYEQRSSPPWLLMLVSLVIATPLAYLLNIRFDEAYTLNTTANGVVDAFRQAIGFGQQAPLYFSAIAVWRSVDESVFFARLFSVICLPLFVWVAYAVSKRYLKNVNPLFIAAIAVVHQQTVWNALDIRLYALMTLFSGLLLLLFYDGYLSEKPSSKARIFYVIVAVLSLYTQYYLGFQLVAGAAVLLVLGRWKVLLRYVGDMAIAGVIFIPMLLILSGQLSEFSGSIELPLSATDMLREMWQRIVALVLAVAWMPWEGERKWAMRFILFIVVALFLLKIAREKQAEDIALGVYTVVLIGFFMFAMKFAGWTLTQNRHMSSLILPLTLIPFAAFSVFKSKTLVTMWFVLVTLLCVWSLAMVYSPLAKPGDFERVAQHLMQSERPNEPILVFHADAVWPLRQYYHGQNQLVALPQENALEKWDPRNNVIKNEAQLVERINSAAGSAGQVWLVYDGWCGQGSLKFKCDLLEDVINKYFTVEQTRRFFEPTTVRLLKRREAPVGKPADAN
ncbi:MAG: glycosyltransferase family 39 protein [Acidobacteria bacterium]|nr:glycosyltransferase family 39 protein [Acidobacteriota bacterium]